MILTTASLLVTFLLKLGPTVAYTVTIDPADTTSIQVAMVIQAARTPETRIAMAVHPEYNDRFWRFIRDMRAEVDGERVTITTLSDHSWRVPTPIGNHRTTITYRIQLPSESSTNRAVWHTTLRHNGASINSTDTFLYLPDYPRSLVGLAFRAPDDWQIRSGLSCTFRDISPGTRSCAGESGATVVDASTLLDSPILLGDLHTWSFAVQGVPHQVIYWPLPGSTPFDTTAFVDGIRRYAREAFAVFRRAPYTKYTFLIEDGAWGGLEHRNSVSIGVRSGDLAKDPHAIMGEIAHEYFHTWNLMALNPRGVPVASADTPSHTRELWWSEGVTMYYAETLQRRAGIPEEGKTRLLELQEELDRFHADSGNSYLSPERGSWVSIDPPTAATGDYLSNYYVQGRLIAYALDRIIFDSTSGRKGIDDVMRLMYERHANKSAFTGADIERAVHDVCQCDIHRFFEDHVRNARPIDFNPLLAPLGLHVVLSTEPVADDTVARPDLRMLAYVPPNGGRLRVRIMDPRSVWSRAGIHTGMELVSLNRVAIDSFPDFRRAIRTIHLDDVVPIEVLSEGVPRKLDVRVTGYSRTRARVVEAEPVTPSQLRLRTQWLAAR
jgi:predicted metalloprotease with PDZ domain